MVPATALLVAGTLGIATAPDGGWLWAIVCGAGIGTLFPTMMTLPIDVADRSEAVGAVAGLMLLVGYVGAAPTPSLLGALRDWTGSYAATTWSLFVVAVGALFVASLLSHQRMARGVP
jgi:CP family cyanate transporter-like MFS transporter